MRKIFITAFALTVVTALLGPGPARAEHGGVGLSWSVASSFHIGGADVALVLGTPLSPVPGYGPVYYYRTTYPLPGFYGPGCYGCFARGGFYYYDVNSPLIGAYLTRYDFPVARFWIGAGPFAAPRARLVRPVPRPRFIVVTPVHRHAPWAHGHAPRFRSHAARSFRDTHGRDWRHEDRGHGRNRRH